MSAGTRERETITADESNRERDDVAEPGRRRHRLSVTAVALGAGFLLSASATTADARPSVFFQQATGDAASGSADPIGAVHGSHASLSGDGRFVVFQGRPGTEAGADQPSDTRETTVYLTDRVDGSTVELTPVPPGLRPGNTVHPVISGDGCTVVAITEMALDVFRDDDLGSRWDVYRSTLPHCAGTLTDWELVSTREDGTSLARDDVSPTDRPGVSRSGTEIVFTHPATHLYDGEELTAVTLVDLSKEIDNPLRMQLVAGTPADSPSTTFVHAGLDQPAISGDGRFVAYRSDAASAEAVPIWGEGPVAGAAATKQVFVWDRQEADPFLAVRLVSVRPNGDAAAAGASQPTLSRDGRVIAFTSADVGLVPAMFPECDVACPTQVYRLDRDTDRNGWFDEPNGTSLTLVSGEPGTAPAVAGTAPSSQPALTADGELVVFVSKAPNLQLIHVRGGGGADDGDVLVANVTTGELRRITVSGDGVQPTIGAHARPAVGDTGRTTVFDTLVAGEFLTDGDVVGRHVVALESPPTLSLADADLGTTVVGLQSDEWYVAVINEGPSSFIPSQVSVDNPAFKINTETSTCTLGTSVPPGGDCTVRLTFTPATGGPAIGKLTIAEAGFGALSVSSTVSGAGGEPALRIDPGGADIGLVEIGASATEFQFDVMNISQVPTSVAAVRVSGSHPYDFAITANNCADRPLNPRANCSVGVTFTPTAPGRRTALVEIATPEGAYTSMVIAGDATYAPEIVLSTSEVSAGREFVAAGTRYPPNTDVTVVFGDGVGDSVTVTTDDNGAFFVAVPVAPNERGGDRTIVVQTPGATATAVAEVKVIEESTALMIGMPGFGLG